MSPFAKTVRGLLEPIAFHGAVEDVVTVLVDDERHMHLIQMAVAFSSVGPS